MDKLFILLDLQRKALEAQSRDSLIHIIVNETLKIIPYTSGIFFSDDSISINLEKISGNSVLDTQSIFATDLKKKIKSFLLDKKQSIVILRPDIQETNGALLLFSTDQEGFLGGLWLENIQTYSDAEKRILEEIVLIYSHYLALWELRASGSILSFFKKKGKWKNYIIIASVFLAAWPVRLSISAPAEIVAKEAEIITAPFDGIIEKIEAEPGDLVKEEDILVVMENQSLQSQMDIAEQEILVAQSALSRMQRESLTSPEKKINLIQLQEEIESKKISKNFTKEMKERSEIKASSSGVAVFSGSHPLKGKPVRTGEKIMMIADPSRYELLVRVPVDSMIKIPEEGNIKFFLNTSPFYNHTAKIRSIGYQASIDPDGLMTYKILASLSNKSNDMRIGWNGTAHIKGEWTILSFAILRRPFITLRNIIGV